MENFFNVIRKKMANITEESRREDAENITTSSDNVLTNDVPDIEKYKRIAQEENEERRRREEEMARTLAKLNQDEMLNDDDIAHAIESVIETKPAISKPITIQESVTGSAKDVLQEQASKIIGTTVLQKPSSPDKPQELPKSDSEEKTFDDERFNSAFWD